MVVEGLKTQTTPSLSYSCMGGLVCTMYGCQRSQNADKLSHQVLTPICYVQMRAMAAAAAATAAMKSHEAFDIHAGGTDYETGNLNQSPEFRVENWRLSSPSEFTVISVGIRTPLGQRKFYNFSARFWGGFFHFFSAISAINSVVTTVPI